MVFNLSSSFLFIYLILLILQNQTHSKEVESDSGFAEHGESSNKDSLRQLAGNTDKG